MFSFSHDEVIGGRTITRPNKKNIAIVASSVFIILVALLVYYLVANNSGTYGSIKSTPYSTKFSLNPVSLPLKIEGEKFTNENGNFIRWEGFIRNISTQSVTITDIQVVAQGQNTKQNKLQSFARDSGLYSRMEIKSQSSWKFSEDLYWATPDVAKNLEMKVVGSLGTVSGALPAPSSSAIQTNPNPNTPIPSVSNAPSSSSQEWPIKGTWVLSEAGVNTSIVYKETASAKGKLSVWVDVKELTLSIQNLTSTGVSYRIFEVVYYTNGEIEESNSKVNSFQSGIISKSSLYGANKEIKKIEFYIMVLN